MVLWTDDPGDFARPTASTIEERVLSTVRNGSIILLHDGIPETLEMLPGLIDKLRKQGYKFVTISDMARNKGAIITGGPHIRLRPDVNAGQVPVKIDTAGFVQPIGGGVAASDSARRGTAMRSPEISPATSGRQIFGRPNEPKMGRR